MRVAFYAPMKSPDAARPSGDRTIARLLVQALGEGGADVRLASRTRTWTATPDNNHLAALQAAAGYEAAALVRSFEDPSQAWRPDLWFTYHSYYKAPDLIGQNVADALAIPYVIVEASYAARREATEWAGWLAAARTGIGRADAIFSFTARDRNGLAGLVAPDRLHHLAPFLDLDGFLPPTPRPVNEPLRLVTVAMMRPGAKQRSYELLARSLDHLSDLPWQLDVVGDGPAREPIRSHFSANLAPRIIWHGEAAAAEVREILARADLFVWPGIDEAFGMAYLEAQACGLPVAACRTAGVPEVVTHTVTGLLADRTKPADFAATVRQLITDDDLRQRQAAAARVAIEERHSLSSAARDIAATLQRLVNRK